MKRPTKKQIAEFWEWCGIYQDVDSWWFYSDGSKRRSKPPLDLDNIFKLAVPKLLHCSIERVYLDKADYRAVIEIAGCRKIGEAYNTNPVYALFYAICEVIKCQQLAGGGSEKE